MERMYQAYKDIADFYIVYISEAHAADDRFPVPYAKKKGIMEHKTYGDRCAVASRLVSDKKLTIPCLIDDMSNAVEKQYHGWPDRVFLIRKDGRLAVAGKRGPWGFHPAIDAAKKWLGEYQDTGLEPTLKLEEAQKGAEHSKTSEASSTHGQPSNKKKSAAVDLAQADRLIGKWTMKTKLGDNAIDAVMVIDRTGDVVSGTWLSQGRTMKMHDLAFDGTKLSFKRMIGEQALTFSGKIDGQRITGHYDGPFGTLECTGKRTETTSQTEQTESTGHQPRTVKAFVQRRPGGPRTMAEMRVHKVPVDPKTVSADQANLPNDALVLGVEVDEQAMAFPIRYLAMYEVVNSAAGHTPVAATW